MINICVAQLALKIEGISEPPELTGAPKQIRQLTAAERQIFEIIGHLKDENEAKAALPALDKLIQEHSDYSDAYFLRAYVNGCMLNTKDFSQLTSDIRAAKAHPGAAVYNEMDYESLLGKIANEKSNYAEAIGHLENAMKKDPDNGDRMFNIEGIEPERTSKFCIWNLSDLDNLVAKFPTDYRSWLFRGLYYEFFTTFKEDWYQIAAHNFRRAALLNPKSALPEYYTGRLYDKASFWTKKAWASDAGRDEPIRKAIQAYTSAIQIEPKFWRTYEQRASGYLNLKQYSQAIKDFDMVLTLNPEYVSAVSDRGVAKLDSGQYFAATIDLGEAIRLKKKIEDESFLESLYEYRGDAEVRLNWYQEAIADYSHAIEKDLSNLILIISLDQFRALYPEYDKVSDEVVLRKLNTLFYPQYEYAVFKQQLEKNGTWPVSLVNELYEKRGDAYLRVGDFRRGVLDFNRIFKGIPNFADSTDRWRLLGRGADGEKYYMDVKSAQVSGGDSGHLWVKTIGKKETQTVAYEIDCKGRLLNSGSEAAYDPSGKLLRSSDLDGRWQQIVPDTIGEQLYSGTCSSTGPQ